ncbi:MFS transporter [Symbioplanes lichenis]|uniref:MFS transporter n=1 Tax=Symbioplanes lichenis TaxID=1629072 RepID=UPI0027388CD0|nr:MFS transporter [Actinoplanes lichenis]
MTDFRLLASGMTLSWLGNGFQTVALAVAVLVAGGGAGDLGLVMAATVVALLICTLFGGVWADRVQPQRLMVLSDAVRVLTTAAVAVMFASGTYHLVVLCVLVAVSAGAGAFFEPAMSALKPMLVPPERRRQANATLSMLQNACRVAGPALGGVVVAAAGAPAGFAVNAVSFAASGVAALLIRTRATRVAGAGLLSELGAGWRAIRERDWLLTGTLAATGYHLANGVVLVLVQVVAVEQLGGARTAGFVAAAEGVGGVLGAAVALRWRTRRLLLAGWPGVLLMPLWALAYVWPGTLVAVLAGAVVGYAGLFFYAVAWDTAVQDHVPHSVLARVVSWEILGSYLALPVGNALAGPLARSIGIDTSLMAAAAVMFGAALVPLTVRGTRELTRPQPRSAPPPSPRPPAARARR